MSETTLVKRYRFLGRDGKDTLGFLRIHLEDNLHLYREQAIFSRSGGRSGDLGKEVLEHELYIHGREGGYNIGSVQVYSVIDDSCNGYAQMVSVLIFLPDDSEIRAQLLSYLDENEFVGSHTSFMGRPAGWHSYRAYLDELPHLSGLHEAFGANDGK